MLPRNTAVLTARLLRQLGPTVITSIAKPIVAGRRLGTFVAVAAVAAAIAVGPARSAAAQVVPADAVKALSMYVTVSAKELTGSSLTITVPVASIGIRG